MIKQPEAAARPERVTERGSVIVGLMESLRFYLSCLCNVALELGFIGAWLKIHMLYEEYVVDHLPPGTTKTVSVALVLLFEVLNLILVVKFGIAHFKSNAAHRK